MALQSEVSPPMVGDPNKDTQIEGDTKSDDEESSQSTDEDVDLEEGEILDSGEEAEEEKKDLTNSSLQEALDKDFLKDIEQLVSQAKAELPATNIINKSLSPHSSPHKKKKSSKYLDHDKFEDNSDHDDGWYSPSRKHKSSKYDAKPIDYRKELEAYRGTPPSSPDSKHREKKKKRSSKKSKKSSKKAIRRKDIKGEKVRKFIKEANKFRICKFFKEGNCAKGADCGFSHATPKSFKKKELCKFYLSGHCNKGSDCAYMHGEFPCKFYHTGSECYAKDNCRFSHAPLTEETQRILDDYLHINRGEDERMDLRDRIDRKRRNSPSPSPEPMPPPPSKRICLLGSPPRHIREAEETKRWQEEMLMQQQNHPSFKIHISPSRDCLTPPPFSRPNFYQETLPDTPSPKKIRLNSEANPHAMNFPQPSSASGYPMPKIEPSVPSPDDNFIYEEDYLDMEDEVPKIKQEPLDVPDFNWTDMHTVEHNMPTIKKETFDTNQPDLDFTNDVKFDETTQFSEMESSVDCNVSSPPNSFETPAIKKEIVEDSDNDAFNEELNNELEEKITNDMNPVQEPTPPPPPIMIPSHLPKKQQELFKRIFQHQKKTEMAASASDASNSPKSYDNAEPEVKEIEETDEKTKNKSEKSKPSVWSSSEDDDDDDDSVEPLTDVLKKLQKEPPVSNITNKVESKPAASLMAMLNKIQQNTLQKNRNVQETQQSDFFKNLLHGNISSNDGLQLPGLNMFSEPKRRALLPDPEPVIKKEPVDAPKDPRLKNRDPRTLASSVSQINLPKTLEQTPLQTSSSLISSTAKTTILSTPSVITESTIDVPYKLRGIYTKPPNYTPYINASQSNPNLLKDPRLRKHLNLQNNENGMETKKDADSLKSHPKDIPPIPKLLLEYDKHSLNINIFESNPVPKPISEEIQDIKPIFPKISDPRMRRRDSQNSSGSNTPPHLSIENSVSPPIKTLNSFENVKIKEEKMWSPPVLEKAWLPPVLEPSVTIKQEVDSDTDDPCRLEIDESPQNSSSKLDDDSPPVLTKKAIPSPASHLPRAIADPRMARLHNPLDSRRLRVGSSESSNKTVELSKVSPKQNSPPKEILMDASKASTSVVAEDDNNCKKLKSIPGKKSEKSEEKKKTVHRNRKSSMDYASPLNSCDDSNSNKGLNYNSYNQRQPRTSASHISSDSNNSTNLVIPETSSDFLSDNSNLECDNSSDVNLKDMFKTIDPTASPFC